VQVAVGGAQAAVAEALADHLELGAAIDTLNRIAISHITQARVPTAA
jgi:hypothetical protein